MIERVSSADFQPYERRLLEPIKRIAASLSLIRQGHAQRIADSLSAITENPRFQRPKDSMGLESRQATELIALMQFLRGLSLEDSDFHAEWFARLLGELLFNLKLDFPNMPRELLEEIWQQLEDIKMRHPKFHQVVLSPFMAYESENLHFPYSKEITTLSEFMGNVNADQEIDFESEVSQKHVAVVIPFLISTEEKYGERGALFVENLSRLQEQTHGNIDICVMLNKCDWDQERIKAFIEAHGLRRVLVSSENVGAARGRNEWIRRLMDEGRADFFMFLDDDTYLTDNRTIAKLAYYLEKNPHFGGISPQIIHRNVGAGAILKKGFEPPWEFSAFPGFEEFDKAQFKSSPIWNEAFLLEGSCVMFSKDVLSRTQLYPEEYNYYHEETQMEALIKQTQGNINVVLQSVYATHKRIGGGAASPHAIYYLYRNYAYMLQDVGVMSKSPQTYRMMLSNFKAYCDGLVEAESGARRAAMARRLEQAHIEVELLGNSRKRSRGNEDFNADGQVELVLLDEAGGSL